jgi:hypothetical protein
MQRAMSGKHGHGMAMLQVVSNIQAELQSHCLMAYRLAAMSDMRSH